MVKLLWIAAGGAAGAVLRYVAASVGQSLTQSPFPLGTLLVNVSGCLAAGFVAGLFANASLASEELRLLLVVGFLGGFTTFSAFGVETLLLASAGRTWLAIGNVAASNVFGLGAAWVAYRAAGLCAGAKG
jgi:CrcB protein